MVKKNVKQTKNKKNAMLAQLLSNMAKKKQKRTATTQKQRPAGGGGSTMGPITAISTAPVAIGNSIRGATSVSKNTNNGVIVRGRDFMFTPIGSGSVTTWCTVGGTPLTPVAFGDSVVRQYLQMYQKYRWRRCAVHYITSSPTSANGDVMFYHAKNRDSVYLNQTSNFLLPFVISDPDTVLGPQWTNHSAMLHMQGSWKSTDYGMTANLNDYADGEVYLLSKTTTLDSPGYVLFDYEIEFAEQQISPRLLTLPIPRAQYNNVAGSWTSTVFVAGNVLSLPITGTTISGATSVMPAGAAVGDIYKVIFDISNSSFTAPATNANFARNILVSSLDNVALNLSDGLTCYALYNGISLYFFDNSSAAYADVLTSAWAYQTSQTASLSIQMWISYVGSRSTTNLVPNF
jgi:hypothetical protein